MQVVFDMEQTTEQLVLGKPIYTMGESSAYFEAYRHVLQALLNIRDEKDMPFPRYFVQCQSPIRLPAYLLNNPQMDLTCLS